MKPFYKILKFLLIFSVVCAWAFNFPPTPFLKNFGGHGWPVIWQDPRVPPKVQEAKAAISTYDFSLCGSTCDTSTDWQAFADDVDKFPFGGSSSNRNDHVEATDAQYTAISSSNDSRWTSDDPGFNDEILFWSEMKINEDPSTISNIDLVWEGYLTGGSSATFSIWVLTSGAAYQTDASWTQVGTTQAISGTADTTMTRSITANFSNYIGTDGMLTWVVYESVSSQSLNTDYVKAVVTYTNNPPSLTVSQPDGVSDTVVIGQSYNLTYDLSDAEDIATVDFYYDSNSSGLDGTAIASCQDQAEGTGATCSWNTTGMTPGDYYVYGIATDGVNPEVNDYSPGVITLQAVIVSVAITTDGNVAYGIMPANTSKSTLPGDLNDIQMAANDGNVAENFNIKGQNASGGGCTWILASTNGSDQYVHQFCNDTDYDCSSPPTNYTALTASYQSLDTDIPTSGTVDFQLKITMPTESSCYGQQSVDVVIQAVQ